MNIRTELPSLHRLSTIDNRLLEELFDHAHDLTFFVKDAEARYVVVNECLVGRHGYKRKSQVIGKTTLETCPGELGRILHEQDQVVLEKGKPIVELLEMHWYSPNTPGWCVTTKLPILDEKLSVLGIVGISQDVRTQIANEEIPSGIGTALNHLERNYSEPVSPSSLAKVANLTPARFARVIKRIFQLTPIQLISKTRLTAAARMLRETDKSISEIAIASGFYDHSAFTRAFRTSLGLSPSAFRREFSSNQNRRPEAN
jgi:AraC-like DNA-binding protein